jgi:dihydroorotate dehydrogenase
MPQRPAVHFFMTHCLDRVYQRVIRPLMFRLDPETAHALAICTLSWLPAARKTQDPPQLASNLWGLEFRNPVGLAAGMDKDARAVGGWRWMGFGFAELGTVTPLPQPGNPRPRLWRLVHEQALINQLGFPSAGMEVVGRRLKRLRRSDLGIKLGISLGPNKTTARERVAKDYSALVARLAPLADFIVVNLSSPNTPGLRELQAAHEMRGLLAAILESRSAAFTKHKPVPLGLISDRTATPPECMLAHKTASGEQQVPSVPRVASGERCEPYGVRPLLVKLAPDLDLGALERACDTMLELGVDGVVACNTTSSRDVIENQSLPAGGLSGQPLKARARQVIRAIYRHTQGRLPIIGVGGIGCAEDAYGHICAGASLVELYTALVFEGPTLVARVKRGLCGLLRRDGFSSIAEAVGTQA